jgi:hypothetical protein
MSIGKEIPMAVAGNGLNGQTRQFTGTPNRELIEQPVANSCSQFAQATALISGAGLVSWLIGFLNRPAIQWLDWPIVVGIDFLRTA